MTAIQLREGRGAFGVVGHVGVGHVHSHSGFVQDDSVGFAVAAGLLQRALQVKGVQDGIDAVRRVLKYCWFDPKTES